jgi:hypothetical protein
MAISKLAGAIGAALAVFSGAALSANVAVCCDTALAARVQGLGHNVKAFSVPAEVTKEALKGYKVFYVTTGYADDLVPQATLLQRWVKKGRGMIIEQPNLTGPVMLLPLKLRINIFSFDYDGSHGGADAVRNVALTALGATHPLSQGLDTLDIGENADRVKSADVPAKWKVLGVQTTNTDYVALAAANYGLGRMVFETNNNTPAAFRPGSDLYLNRMIDWVRGAIAAEAEDD